MLGAIIGDVVGSIYEWNNINTKEFQLFDKKCHFTDDTVMTIAVAEALLNGGSTDNFIDSMKKYGRIYPNYGYGVHFNEWLISESREPYNSFGNGSAMRVAPCGWFANSLEEAETLAEKSAAVTHNHPEGVKGAQATAAAIYLARTLPDKLEDVEEYNRITEKMNGLTNNQLLEVIKERSLIPHPKKVKIKNYIEEKYGYDLNRSLDEMRPVYAFNETCQETVPEAIIAFLESNDFEDAIRNAISLGGDSDTLAAITGSIAEAYYNIDSYTTTGVFHYLDDTLSCVINSWLDAGKPLGALIKKDRWRTDEFVKPKNIKIELHLTKTHFARARLGLLPKEMEDKWFVYFSNARLCFHRSWTGFKIFEAKIEKSESDYIISEFLVERDGDRYKNVDDNEDIRSLLYLIGRGLLGLNIDLPKNSGSEVDALRGWSSFGRMLL